MTKALFNALASHYDVINKVISFGQDKQWRRALSRLLPLSAGLTYVDVGTGTGDVLFTVTEPRSWTHAHGVDPAQAMLAIANQKSAYLVPQPQWHCAPAELLPFHNDFADVMTMAFAIRNVTDRLQSLREMARILKPNGVMAIMEFSWPTACWIRWPFNLYFRFIMPAMGGLISGQHHSYRYLAKSVSEFPSPDEFESMLTEAGLRPTTRVSLSAGMVHIYLATK